MADPEPMPQIISRKAAQAAGLMFYFTGLRCWRGHLDPRPVSSGDCVKCRQIIDSVRSQIQSKIRAERRALRRAEKALLPREVAKRNGESRFWPGVPCKYGHFAQRGTISRRCVECARLCRAATYGEKNRIAARKYRNENIERHRDYARIRTSRRRCATGSHTAEDIHELFKIQNGLCAYCKKKLKRFHVDHVKPISKGGSNDRANLQITCQTCNSRKKDKDPEAFARELGLLI